MADVELFYQRAGCTSCARTRAVLVKRGARVRWERQSRRAPLSDAEAKALLSGVAEVVIAKGKSRRRVKAKEATIADLRGPTGAFRAPIVKAGKMLLVGFDEETLESMVGGQP